MASNTPIVFDALELDLCIEFRQILQPEAGQAALRDWVAAGTVHIKVAVTTENAQVSILQLPGRPLGLYNSHTGVCPATISVPSENGLTASGPGRAQTRL